ncbi:DUF72 domain-containing protein [candidate division KSB1 bacterium]|nr:DUF72 domain-containing protein [candidate division KSB1 bacterium]
MNNQYPSYFVGTSGWTYDHWKKLFYPEDQPKSRWFEYYCQKFTTVEINATFYRFFKDQTYEKWYRNSPPEFSYVLKAPKLITHRKYLKDVEDDIKRFCDSAAILKNKFGMILLQLAPATPYEPERLKKALLAFKDPQKVAVEFRHKKWMTAETKALLTETGSVFCIVDSPNLPLMDWLTSGNAYIRCHGRSKWYAYNYTDNDLKEIAEMACQLKSNGAEKVYIFFNNDYNACAPKNALTLIDLLQQL